jgi:rubredoxin/transcription antitermination factor NusA-like protein
MTDIDYNPFGNQGIVLKFPCKKCGYWIKTDEIGLPSPDFSAETARDSYNDNEDYAVCPKCDEEYNISVWASYAGGYIDIHELDDESEVEVEEIPEPYEDYYDDRYEAITENRQFLKNYETEIDSILKLNDIELSEIELNKTLKRQLFIGAITAVETFLSDTFINLTLTNTEYLKNFIETHPEFKKRKIEFKEIYKAHENLEKIAKDVMIDMLYHDLPKIREMFKATFKIEFPELKDLIKEVSIRHHLVHRSGKTKDGEIIEINKDDVERVIDTSNKFIEKIADELNLKELEIPDLF